MRGTIYTLHYILSKEPMKCVWRIVSVHVSLHGISDCRCCYKVSANEFCQRQLWTWWNGQSRDEKLALCSLARCCTLCLTCASCPKERKKSWPLVPLSVLYWCCSDLLQQIYPPHTSCPQSDPSAPGRWHRVMLGLKFPRAACLL